MHDPKNDTVKKKHRFMGKRTYRPGSDLWHTRWYVLVDRVFLIQLKCEDSNRWLTALIRSLKWNRGRLLGELHLDTPT